MKISRCYKNVKWYYIHISIKELCEMHILILPCFSVCMFDKHLSSLFRKILLLDSPLDSIAFLYFISNILNTIHFILHEKFKEFFILWSFLDGSQLLAYAIFWCFLQSGFFFFFFSASGGMGSRKLRRVGLSQELCDRLNRHQIVTCQVKFI